MGIGEQFGVDGGSDEMEVFVKLVVAAVEGGEGGGEIAKVGH